MMAATLWWPNIFIERHLTAHTCFGPSNEGNNLFVLLFFSAEICGFFVRPDRRALPRGGEVCERFRRGSFSFPFSDHLSPGAG
jgi:hypothetical protein